jgi:hypothetical protein
MVGKKVPVSSQYMMTHSSDTVSIISHFLQQHLHSSTHYHPFLGRATGNDFDLFPAPGPEDFSASTNSYLEVLLTATDPETGLSATKSRIIMPNLVNLTFSSQPSGLEILLGGNKIVTPATVISWTNHTIFVQAFDQKFHQFVEWTDGEDFQYILSVPSEETEYVAVFQELCINPTDEQQEAIHIRSDQLFERNQFYCLGKNYKFGIDGSGAFGFFFKSELIWKPFSMSTATNAKQWTFKDAAIVVLDGADEITWNSDWEATPQFVAIGAVLTLTKDRIRIQRNDVVIWEVTSDQFIQDDELATLNCLNPISYKWRVITGNQYERGDVFCLRDRYKFGIDKSGNFGYFVGSELIWSPTSETVDKFVFQNDGNLVAYSDSNQAVWSSMGGGMYGNAINSQLTVTMDGLIITKDGSTLWEEYVHQFYVDPSCINDNNTDVILVPEQQPHKKGEMYCFGGGAYFFGIHLNGSFGYFHGTQLLWEPNNVKKNLIPNEWVFQEDSNLVVRSRTLDVVWASQWDDAYKPTYNSTFVLSKEKITIESNKTIVWEFILPSGIINNEDEPDSCMGHGMTVSDSLIVVPVDQIFRRGDVYCLNDNTSIYKFGMDQDGNFGYFVNSELVWKPDNMVNNMDADQWSFQGDGNLVVRSETVPVWASNWAASLLDVNATGAVLIVSTDGMTIEKDGVVLWELDIDKVMLDDARQKFQGRELTQAYTISE